MESLGGTVYLMTRPRLARLLVLRLEPEMSYGTYAIVASMYVIHEETLQWIQLGR